MKIKKIILIIIAAVIVIAIGALLLKPSENKNNSKLKIVTSNFASYDFLRAIIGNSENVELTFLLGPGKDSHSYDPTAGDLIKIQNADLFIYVGGEMEKWSDKVMSSLDTTGVKVICIADYVDKIDEKEIDGAEVHNHEEEESHDQEEKNEDEEGNEHEEDSFDEHIWTSPSNAIKMLNALEKAVEEIDEQNSKFYKENAEKYVSQIKEVDKKIQEIVDNKVRDRLIFADKMPMQYFIDYYKLQVTAAFSGCSTETEPSAATIAYIENKAKEEKIPVILYIELNNGQVAKTIASDIGNEAEAMQIQTLHNIILDDFKNGETWVSLMTRNLEVLKKALQ